MATIDLEDFNGMAADAALTTTRTLPGAGTRTWAASGTYIRSNGSGVGFAYEDSARAWVDVGADANFQITTDFNMATACNIMVGGLKTDGSASWNAAVVALLVGLTDLRIRQYDAGGSPTDLATDTVSLSLSTNYKLQFYRNGNSLKAIVLSGAGSVIKTLPFTAVSALPSGNFWGMGFVNGGTTATFDNILIEDAPAASAVWANCANV